MAACVRSLAPNLDRMFRNLALERKRIFEKPSENLSSVFDQASLLNHRWNVSRTAVRRPLVCTDKVLQEKLLGIGNRRPGREPIEEE